MVYLEKRIKLITYIVITILTAFFSFVKKEEIGELVKIVIENIQVNFGTHNINANGNVNIKK